MQRQMLSSEQVEMIITHGLANKPGWVRREVLTEHQGIAINVTYFYNQNKNAVVIPGPLAVAAATDNPDAFEPVYENTVNSIKQDLSNPPRLSISAPLIGKGTGERHYVASHQSSNGSMIIFDSKISDPTRFLSSANAPTFFEKLWGYVTTPFRTWRLRKFNTGRLVNAPFMGDNVLVHRLDTQPMFDGVSCGLHAAGAVLQMSDTIMSLNNVDVNTIYEPIIRNRQFDVRAENILLGRAEPQTRTRSHDVTLTSHQPYSRESLNETEAWMQTRTRSEVKSKGFSFFSFLRPAKRSDHEYHYIPSNEDVSAIWRR